MINNRTTIKVNKQNLPHILIDMIHQNSILVRMPKKDGQTPEFRLVMNTEKDDVNNLITEMRHLIEKAYKS